MWIYVVTWLIYEWVSVPCPDKLPGCLVDHSEAKYAGIEVKTFYNRDSALMFYRESIPKDGYVNFDLKDSVKIDSIKLDYIDQPFLWTRGEKTFYFFK